MVRHANFAPMKREQAAEWQAFFMQCEGRANTFLLGDPDAKTVTGGAAPSSVSFASAEPKGETSLNLTIGSGKKINKGSYLQVGTGSNAKLYMVVDDNTGKRIGHNPTAAKGGSSKWHKRRHNISARCVPHG